MKIPHNFVTKKECEYLRVIAKQRFDYCIPTWLDLGKWAAPHRIKWMLSQMPGERNNAHIVDATHILALRSYVAGFLEGNTSASRPWFRFATSNEDINDAPDNHLWLQRYTARCLEVLGNSNFYNAAGQFYYDYGVFNTGCHYIEELQDRLYFHTLMPGSYYLINDGYNNPIVMSREFSLTVKAIVETYGKKDKHGNWDWSNISPQVQKMYQDGNYTTILSVVHQIKNNEKYDPSQPQVLLNKPWLSITYELGGPGGQYYQYAQEFGEVSPDPWQPQLFLNVSASRRKPFVVGKSDSVNNFEYGEKGPTLDALGLIKSANKKAIAKDQALELMLRPPMQGPASLKKSYITTAANSYVPLDPTSLSQKGLRSIFEINPSIPMLVNDVSDLRQQIGKIYYEDYLLYLTQNPKTRTAAETNAIVQEQQLVIGPNLQSLNETYNTPLIEFIADYVLWDDPYMRQYPVPQQLQGQFLRPEFISVFAQAQRAADLPSIQQFLNMAEQLAQAGQPKIWDKVDVDKIADIYEDRLFLPVGINVPQEKVDAQRQQAQAMAQRQQMLTEHLPAVASAAKDMSVANQNNNGGGPSQ